MRAFNFKINGEEEIVAAETYIEAMRYYCKTNGWDLLGSDFDNKDDIEEIPEHKWGEIEVTNTEYDDNDPEDLETVTLKMLMDGVVTPEIITSSNM